MRRKFSILTLLLLIVLLSGCATQKPPAKEPSQPLENGQASLNDYLAYRENVKYVFEGKGNEYASYTVYVDFIRGSRVQIRTNNGGTEMVKVLENKGGELTVNLMRGECYYREDLTQKSGNQTEILLKEPLVQGTTWMLADGRKRSISNVNMEVVTPAGRFTALEVTTEGKDSVVRDYYAPHQGLVKTLFTSNGYEVTSTLAQVIENSPFIQQVTFFYPNMTDGKLYAMGKQLSFATNALTKSALEKELKNPPQNHLGRVLSPHAVINSLYLNDDNMVYADFSKELVSEMNAGSSFEAMLLQSIVNTLGQYYQTQKVYITVEGKPYASGHFEMKKGEAFTVDLSSSVLPR